MLVLVVRDGGVYSLSYELKFGVVNFAGQFDTLPRSCVNEQHSCSLKHIKGADQTPLLG